MNHGSRPTPPLSLRFLPQQTTPLSLFDYNHRRPPARLAFPFTTVTGERRRPNALRHTPIVYLRSSLLPHHSPASAAPPALPPALSGCYRRLSVIGVHRACHRPSHPSLVTIGCNS
uniref:Uncharacterized protein n=1 Tax=Opuntia streptacantha TaxID=393608 RepID=A0A7C8YFD8_OPUST